MESTDWPSDHSAALREYFAKGMSFAQIARALNASFNTAYSRNAALGRAKRMGLAGPPRPEAPTRAPPSITRELRAEVRTSGFQGSMPASEKVPSIKLRCVAIEPRHLTLIELERGD